MKTGCWENLSFPRQSKELGNYANEIPVKPVEVNGLTTPVME